jgi:bacterioferritin (cytochrome b1)
MKILTLADVITIKNKIGERINYERDDILALKDLITYCEIVGAATTASTLNNMMKNEIKEYNALKELAKLYQKEEERLTSIGPESRYPLVSEHKRAYTVRDHRPRSRY